MPAELRRAYRSIWGKHYWHYCYLVETLDGFEGVALVAEYEKSATAKAKMAKSAVARMTRRKQKSAKTENVTQKSARTKDVTYAVNFPTHVFSRR